MLTVYLKGGLGNQLFQIAALVNLAMENRDIYFIDLNLWPPKGGAASAVWQAGDPKTYRNNVYRNLPLGNVKQLNFKPRNIYREPHQAYKKIPYSTDLLLEGYFASEKYFKGIENIMKELFAPPDEYVKKFNLKNRNDGKEIVSVHIRRGSHLMNPDHHGSCSIDYYKEAMSKFDKENTRFIVFSDDLEWCQENFENVEFSTGQEDYEDFYDMMLCDHNIIANSTFSWWSAWLNKNKDKKVFSPKVWFGPANSHLTVDDLLPKEWKLL